MILTTSRLTLRDYQADDWQAVHLYASDAEFCQYEVWGPNTIEETKKFINDMLEQNKQQPRYKFDFAVCLDNLLIGGCGIRRESEQSLVASLGWAINPQFQHNGFAIIS